MKPVYTLFSDLDRTILPNGVQPESLRARPALQALSARPEMMLAYVSGRDQALLKQAIREYSLPLPRFAVGDVGTTIYEIREGRWHALMAWQELISPDWGGANNKDIVALFNDIELLRMQEPEKQGAFKVSYYTEVAIDNKALVDEMQVRLDQQGIQCCVIWSVDEVANVGLLDVLPASATKLHAIEYLMEYTQCSVDNCVFAGDSGNDLPVIASGRLPSVLVKNAHVDVIAEAQRSLATLGVNNRLYVARGNFYGLNGNYSAGVLEGVAHYFPDSLHWMGLS